MARESTGTILTAVESNLATAIAKFAGGWPAILIGPSVSLSSCDLGLDFGRRF